MNELNLRASAIRLLAAVCAAAAGCAGDIRPEDFMQGGSISDELMPTGPVTTRANPDGTYTTLVDATSDKTWTHVDFEGGTEAVETGPWELRFQRFHISANGGITGAAGVEVTEIADRTFDEIRAAPSAGWITDAPDGDDVNTTPDYALEQGEGWYNYDFERHVLTPRAVVWVVRSGGAAIKLRIERYYDSAGTPGWVKLRWAPLR
jgi:hypothetical protein